MRSYITNNGNGFLRVFLRNLILTSFRFWFSKVEWMGRVVAPHVGDAIMDVSDLGGLFVFGSGWIIALCSLLLVFKKRESSFLMTLHFVVLASKINLKRSTSNLN
eukprot:UN26973